MKSRIRNTSIFLAAVLAASTIPAFADRLEDVVKAGKLVCGTLGVYPPNSFQDPQTRKLIGYDIDVCDAIAAAIGVTPEYKVISAAARVPELSQGRVDVLAANFTYTPDRAKQVDFSNTYFIASENIAVKADSGLSSLKDLAGKRIATTEGSTSADYARKAIPGASIVTFKDGPSAYLAFAQGRTEGFATNVLVLKQYEADSKANGPEIKVIDEPTFIAPFGIGVAKDQPALLAKVNDTLASMDKDGRMTAIWNKWVGPESKYNIPRTFTVTPVDKY